MQERPRVRRPIGLKLQETGPRCAVLLTEVAHVAIRWGPPRDPSFPDGSHIRRVSQGSRWQVPVQAADVCASSIPLIAIRQIAGNVASNLLNAQ